MSGRVEVYPDSEGGWRFRVVAGNNEKVGASESYSTKAGAEEGVEALKRALGLYDEEQWGYSINITGKGAEYHTSPSSDRKSAESMITMYERIDNSDGTAIDWKVDPKLVRRNILVTEWEEVVD